MIYCEIDVVIRSRVARMLQLGQKERVVLEGELAKIPNRTYLIRNYRLH